MKKLVNGQYLDMTAEEIAALNALAEEVAPAEPTAEERLAALEAAMLELITGGDA